jgi:PAS domain S-box-containing protein
VSESRFDEMKRYVRFGDEEARLLMTFGVVAAPSFPSIAATFYDRIREHEDAHAVFAGEAQIARLQSSMVRWLTRLCGGTYDESYSEATARIGRVHVKAGLPERYMFTAMALIRVALCEIADREMGASAQRARAALVTLLDLELAIMMDSYRAHLVARLQRVERLENEEPGRSPTRAEHGYKSALELAHVMLIGLDARGQIQLFNGEAERVTGFAQDEAVGQAFLDLLIPEESRVAEGARISRTLAGSEPKGTEVEGVVGTRSGRIRIVHWQFALAPSDTANDVALFVIGRDTTEQVALADRTRQREKLAAVGTLAAGLAHEIRNPLNGAQLHLAYLERTLKRSQAPQPLREAVTVVGDEITRLATLVSKFLDFARPTPLETSPVSLRALCDRSLQAVAAQAAAHNVALHQDLPSQDVMLEGDPDKLEQALLNLLHNAVEASAQGHGTAITLRARRQPRHIVVEVEDDGPGLVRPDSPVFDAFYSTKPSGTGLGLAIAHRIVTDHTGTIDVDSRPGRTVFRITLPVVGPVGRTTPGETTGET